MQPEDMTFGMLFLKDELPPAAATPARGPCLDEENGLDVLLELIARQLAEHGRRVRMRAVIEGQQEPSFSRRFRQFRTGCPLDAGFRYKE
jgi:hypothetical protein